MPDSLICYTQFYNYSYPNRSLSEKLHELKESIQNAVVNRVVEDFVDIASPLKQFTEAVHVPEGMSDFIFGSLFVLIKCQLLHRFL
jgi:hypothetical protein